MSSKNDSCILPLCRLDREGVTRRDAHLPEGLISVSTMEVVFKIALPEQCFVLPLEQEFGAGYLEGRQHGAFSLDATLPALDSIYLLRIGDNLPSLFKVLRNDREKKLIPPAGKEKTPLARVNVRRKSFMTPTPLHVPEARVSPIPESAHEMVLLKSLKEDNAATKVVPVRDIQWMAPLVWLSGEAEVSGP